MAVGISRNYTIGSNNSSFDLHVSVHQTYDPKANTSDVTIRTDVRSYEYKGYYYPSGTIKLNGVTVVEFNSKTPTHMLNVQELYTDYRFTDTSGNPKSSWTITVDHDTDGSKSIEVDVDFKLYTVGGTNGHGSRFDLTKTYDLTQIDREPPTVSFSVSNITTNSFKISATSDLSCDEWYYSLDNGATWTSYHTGSRTAAETTVTGLAVDTLYHVKVHARRTYNAVPGISQTVSVKTLGHAIINSCADFYADEATVTLNPNVTVYESSFTERLILKDGSTELFSINSLSFTAGTENRAITLNNEQKQALLRAMPKATLTLTLELKTYNGSTLVGTSTCTAVAKTSNENSKPAWAAPYISWEDTSACAAVTGNPTIMVQGYSNLVVTAIGVTPRNYATIADYTVTIGDKTVKSSSPEINVGKIEVDGDLTLKLTVTDSRGHYHDLYRTVTVLKYSAPKTTKITLRRANGVDPVIQLSFNVSMSAIKPDGNTDVNSLTVAEYYYKPTSETEYGNGIVFTDDVVRSSSGTSLSFDSKELLSLDENGSFNFVLHIADRITSEWNEYVIPKGIPALAIRKDKIGINNPDPQYAVDAKGDVNLTGTLRRNGIDVLYPVGSIYLSVNSTDPGTIFGGTWEQLKDRFLLAAGDTYKAGTTGGEAAHTLTVNELPSHTHNSTTMNTDRTTGNAYVQVNWAYSNDTSSGNAVTNSTGGDQPHNNMPPYLAVYMWVRKS